MKNLLLTGALAALLVPAASMAQAASKPAASMAQTSHVTAKQYVAMAAASDMFEIQSSKLALERGRSAEVKSYAQHMISDHSTTTSDLKAAAQQENISVPKAMMAKQKRMLAKLKATSGTRFDAAYVEMQRMSHKDALALHSSYAKNGDDAALQAVAKKAVPIVEEHYQTVRGLHTA